MPCGIDFIEWLSSRGVVPAVGHILDLGDARLLGAKPDEILALLTRHGTSLTGSALDQACHEMSSRSDPNGPPYSFSLRLAEVFATTQVRYTALGIYQHFSGRTFDPNRDWLPFRLRKSADLTLNFNTSSRIWNQHNAFRLLHNACKTGGRMFHQVAGTGHLGFGMYCYQPVLFDELARTNDYQLTDLWYSGPLSSRTVLSLAERYPGIAESDRLWNDVEGFRTHPVPDAMLNVLLTRSNRSRFKLPRPVDPFAPPIPTLAYRAARKIYRKLRGRN